MLKYVDTKVVFAEVPDEITLAINISGCPCHCAGCHSPYLADDIGEWLTYEAIGGLIEGHSLVSCVALMGGDSDWQEIEKLAGIIKGYGLKAAWYSGRDWLPIVMCTDQFDYIKLGHYDEQKGPLDSPTTNQVMYRLNHEKIEEFEDITHKFKK